MKILILFTTLFFISSCSSTGVLPHAAGTYKVSAHHVLASKAKQKAYDEAISFCLSKDKEMEIINEPANISEHYSIIFRCK